MVRGLGTGAVHRAELGGNLTMQEPTFKPEGMELPLLEAGMA